MEKTTISVLCFLLLPVTAAVQGQLLTLHDFDDCSGVNLNGVTLSRDGDFYGTAFAGGTDFFNYGDGLFDPYGSGGTVFKLAQNGVLIWSFPFSGTNGANPTTLVQGSSGNFYGATYLGGTNGAGTVFQISANGLLTSLFSFNWTNGYEATSILQGKDGSLYGTTYAGGPDYNYLGGPDSNIPADEGFGTVFKIMTNGGFAPLYFFRDGNDGANPVALFQGADGYLYGSTYSGGASNAGTIFRMTTNGGLTTLFSFSGGSDGANPGNSLIRGADGSLYGVTECSGTNAGYGTVFQLQTNGLLATMASFDGTNGAAPTSLMQAQDGDFYGTTQFGGTFSNQFCSGPPYSGSIESSYGTIFRLTTNDALTTLVSFNLTNGVSPNSLAQASDCSLYGVTQFGGTNGQYLVYPVPPPTFTTGGDGTLFCLNISPTNQFEINNDPPYPDSWGPGETVVSINVTNSSTFDMISSFTIYNVYSTTSPSQFLIEGAWVLNVTQNPTNSCLWDLEGSAPYFSFAGFQYIQPNESLMVSFFTTFPTNAQLLFGTLANSAVFVNSGFMQGDPSTFVGPVGWQSGPLVATIQHGETNGTMELSWSGADGNVFLEHKNALAEDKWHMLTGPLSGGAWVIPIASNSPGGFFRLMQAP
jgi:uncharacterized repeat protein (TIGR03803 family)